MSPAGPSASAIAHPWVGASQSRPSAAHSGSDGSVRGVDSSGEHDLGRLDDRSHGVAFRQPELFDARPCHDGDDLVLTDPDDDFAMTPPSLIEVTVPSSLFRALICMRSS